MYRQRLGRDHDTGAAVGTLGQGASQTGRLMTHDGADDDDDRQLRGRRQTAGPDAQKLPAAVRRQIDLSRFT